MTNVFHCGIGKSIDLFAHRRGLTDWFIEEELVTLKTCSTISTASFTQEMKKPRDLKKLLARVTHGCNWTNTWPFETLGRSWSQL